MDAGTANYFGRFARDRMRYLAIDCQVDRINRLLICSKVLSSKALRRLCVSLCDICVIPISHFQIGHGGKFAKALLR
jgi:hypothetical protein